MQKTLIILTVAFMIAVMVYAGINRYSLTPAGARVIKLDRWTGEMWLCFSNSKCEKVEFPE